MGTQNRKKSWAFPLYALALGAFTAYVLLNTFLVSRVYIQAAPAETAESTQSAEAVVTETEYQDGNISIRLSLTGWRIPRCMWRIFSWLLRNT